MAGNARLRVPDAAVCEKTAKQFDAAGEYDLMDLAWQAALRLIGDQAAAYRS